MPEFLQSHLNTLQFGWISLVWEIIVFIACVAIIFTLLIKNIKAKAIIIVYAVTTVLLIASMILDSPLAIYSIVFFLSLFSLIIILYYLPEYKKQFSKLTVNKDSKEFVSNQSVKDELIDTLIKSVEHLASRKIGAIITIEREHTLNTLIEGSVKLDSLVTYELLETIFHPNTALHDGAVIIRGNRIKCASAFYTPSQKKDIPQHYGSRHRAAIGISEQSDAFTIVVSEETGQIATTVGGTITGSITLENLRISLNQQIIVR